MTVAAFKTKISTLWPTSAISGPILFTMWAMVLMDYFFAIELTAVATVFAWVYVVIELSRLTTKQKPLILTLAFAGIGFSVLGWGFGSEATVLELLDEHLKLALL